MSFNFVKTVTTRTILQVIDGDGPDCIYMSVDPLTSGGIDLVIGATFKDKCASALSKDGLRQLIDILTEIHEAMENK